MPVTVIGDWGIGSAAGGGGGTSGSIIQHTSNGNNTGGTSALPITVASTGAGNLLVVAIGWDAGLTISSVTDGTTGFTPATIAQADNGTLKSDIYYLLSSNSGKTTITVNFSGTITFASAIVYEVSWVGGAAQFDVANNIESSAVDVVMTGAAVTSASNSGFIVGVVNPSDTTLANPKAGNEFTSGGDIEAHTSAAACSKIASTADSHTPVWDGNAAGQAFVASTAAFK